MWGCGDEIQGHPSYWMATTCPPRATLFLLSGIGQAWRTGKVLAFDDSVAHEVEPTITLQNLGVLCMYQYLRNSVTTLVHRLSTTVLSPGSFFM